MKISRGSLTRPLSRWWSSNKPTDGTELRTEAVAGIPGAIGSVPDGMAASVLTGVSPIHGLYASLVGPIVGGLSSSTRPMVVTTTSAAALAAGSALQSIAQGSGNLAAGMFPGQPVGGSVGQTALNKTAGARTLWAAICSGIWMLVILVLFSGAVGTVAMACLAAVLILAAISSINPQQIVHRVEQWTQLADRDRRHVHSHTDPADRRCGRTRHGDLTAAPTQSGPRRPARRAVAQAGRRNVRGTRGATAPDESLGDRARHYGSLLYAGARSLQSQLPDPAGTDMPVIVLRLRGRLSFGATFAAVMSDYIDRLADVGGHLILSGVEAELMDQLRASGGSDLEEHVTVYEASSIIGQSTNEAIAAGESWLHDSESDRESDGEPDGE